MKPGRNDPCICGSGKKYKNCCQGKNITPAPQLSQTESNYLVSLSSAGKYAELERYSATLTGIYPGNGLAWKFLGEALYMQGKDAVAALRKAAEFLPNDAETFNNLGIVLTDLGLFDEAVTSCRRALKINPDDSRTYNNLGRALHSLNRYQDAIACYRRAIEISPGYAKAHYNLGNSLINLERAKEAEASYRRAIALKPDYALAYFNLGSALRKQGRKEESSKYFLSYLALDPDDTKGARQLLAAEGLEPMPSKASEAQLLDIYKQRAVSWDKNLDYSQQSYFGAELVSHALRERHDTSGKMDILDAGCGTGLVGLLIKDMANRLDGVDLSPEMLSKAREKNIYHHLFQSDLETYMRNHPDSYDAVTSAATLIHFGDLSSVFSSAASCLRTNGLFIFTVFKSEKEAENFAIPQTEGLALGGCYAHSKHYIQEASRNAGFMIDMIETALHETHGERECLCYIVALRKAPGMAGTH